MMVNFLKENPLHEEYPFTILVGPTFSDTRRGLKLSNGGCLWNVKDLYHFNIFSYRVIIHNFIYFPQGRLKA